MFYYSVSLDCVYNTEEDIERYVSSFLTHMYTQLNIKDGDVTDLQALDLCLDGFEPETVARYVSSALRGIPGRAIIKAEEFGTEDAFRCVIIADEETYLIRYFSWHDLINATWQEFTTSPNMKEEYK